MELQWPLILFTTFIAWSVGVFGTQAIAAFKGEYKNIQLPALIVSFVLLVIGGIAVFFHLEHWERIFNGFGNPTSGITQELIAIVILVVVMVIYFIFLRRDDASGDGIDASKASEEIDKDEKADNSSEKIEIDVETAEMSEKIEIDVKTANASKDSTKGQEAHTAKVAPYFPSWLAIIALVIAVVLDIVMSHSYMMAARPAWNSLFEIFSILGASCVLGPLTFAIIVKAKDKVDGVTATIASASFIGSIVNAATTIIYIVSIALSAGSFMNVGHYFDPTHPTYGVLEPANLASGGSLAITLITIILCLVPVILMAISRKGSSKNWIVFVWISLGAALIATILLRVLMYQMGMTVFAFY